MLDEEKNSRPIDSQRVGPSRCQGVRTVEEAFANPAQLCQSVAATSESSTRVRKTGQGYGQPDIDPPTSAVIGGREDQIASINSDHQSN